MVYVDNNSGMMRHAIFPQRPVFINLTCIYVQVRARECALVCKCECTYVGGGEGGG